jgi:hypothetical protein
MPLNLQAFQEKLSISAQDQDRLDAFRASLAALSGNRGDDGVVAAVMAAHVSAPRRKLTATEHAQYVLVAMLTNAAAQKQRQQQRRGRQYDQDDDEENDDPTKTMGLSMALAAMTESMVATLHRIRDFPTTVRPFFFMSEDGMDDSSSSSTAAASFLDLLQVELERDPLRLPVHLQQLMMDRFHHHNSQSSSSSWLILCSYFLVRLQRDLKIFDDDHDDDSNDDVEKPKANIMDDEFLSSVLYYPEAAALVQVDDFLMHPMQATDEIMTALSQHFAPPPSPKYVAGLFCYTIWNPNEIANFSHQLTGFGDSFLYFFFFSSFLCIYYDTAAAS